MASLSQNELINSLQDGQIISVYAGDRQQPYLVQRAVLQNASKWFRAALSKDFFEGNENTLRLPEADPAAFELLLYWIFNKKLPDPKLGDILKTDDEIFDEHLMDRIRAWVLADAYFLPKLQNAIASQLLEFFAHISPSIEAIREAYVLTGPGSKLRILFMRELGLAFGSSNPEVRYMYVVKDLDSLGSIPSFTTDLVKTFCRGIKQWNVGKLQKSEACFVEEKDEHF